VLEITTRAGPPVSRLTRESRLELGGLVRADSGVRQRNRQRLTEQEIMIPAAGKARDMEQGMTASGHTAGADDHGDGRPRARP